MPNGFPEGLYWFTFPSAMYKSSSCFASLSTLCIYLKNNVIYLFLAVLCLPCRLSLVAMRGGYFFLWCVGFSLQWLLLLQSMGSRVRWLSSCSSRAVGYRLPSCGTCGPRSVVEPVSPESAGRFFTTGRPGKPQRCALNQCVLEL